MDVWPLIPKGHWPAVRFKVKWAITLKLGQVYCVYRCKWPSYTSCQHILLQGFLDNTHWYGFQTMSGQSLGVKCIILDADGFGKYPQCWWPCFSHRSLWGRKSFRPQFL